MKTIDRLLTIWVVSVTGERQAFSFNMERFVSYNVTTRRLVLVSGDVLVHNDSAKRLIEACRAWYGEISDESKG